MGSESQSLNTRCPYLVEPDRGEGSKADLRGRYQCGAEGTAEAVPPHRLASFCHCSRFALCPDYPANPVYEDFADSSEPEPPKGLEATIAEAGVVLLMAGMIAFAVFAIAPRPEESPGSHNMLAAPTQVLAGDSRTTPAPSATVPAATTVPAVSATPIPPTPAPTRAPAPKPTTASGNAYVVRSGDTLYSIARSYGVTVDALLRVNGLADPKKLHTGQTLRIP